MVSVIGFMLYITVHFHEDSIETMAVSPGATLDVTKEVLLLMGGTVSTESASDTTRSKEKGKKKKKAQKGEDASKKDHENQDDKDFILGGDTQSAPYPEAEMHQEVPESLWPPQAPMGPPEEERNIANEPTAFITPPRSPVSPGPIADMSTLLQSPMSERGPVEKSFGIFGYLPPPHGNSSRPYDPHSLGQSAVKGSGALSRCGLRVTVLKAHNLKTTSTGLPGDLSEPYVSVRLGRQIFRTHCVENDPNPVWTDENEHTFQLPVDAKSLELQVMSKNSHQDEVLGKVVVAVRNDEPGQWQRHKVPMAGTNSQLEFEMQLVPEGFKIHDSVAKEDFQYQLGPRMFQPKSHALPWHGVRVVELSRRTWTAALCGQMMATLGAEVLRIDPGLANKSDDLLQPLRVQVPGQLHHGKRLVAFDLQKPEELMSFKSELLMGCNLFLTDLPADELDSMQLGPSILRQQFPWLIFVHTSAVGMVADVTNKGVNDAGAFFCLSGMAEQLGHFLGPPGFAAACAASALLGVASLALLRRRCGCPGDRVEMSIFRSGRWCSALGALTGWARPTTPELRPAAPDSQGATPTTPFDVEGVAHRPLKRGKAERNPKWSLVDPSSLLPAVVPESPIFSELPLARVSVIEISDEYHISAVALGALLADLGARVTKLERPQRPDPWQHTCPQLYKDLSARKTVQVVNYSGVGGRDANGVPLQGQAALYRSLADTTILVTNLPIAALESWGLEPQRLREMFPHLIIVWICTWGSDAIARHKELSLGRKGGQETHAFWEASGLSQLCNGSGMPPGLSELVVAQQALGGVGLALLRQQRTGQGQFVQVSRHRAGVFCHRLAALEPPRPLQSPLLQTLDGRFLRLLGRGHQPHDAWVLLHALKRRD
eukprot:symbB.v1.2.038556.t1/scaffold6050.1/size21439/2